MGRAPCCDKANVKRGSWSPEEDELLRRYIEHHGTAGNWIALPQKAGLRRCGKSCRLRWLNYLRPDIKHGGFTEEEDNIIYTLYNNIGSRWSVIASHLPGRTDNDVKNYWNTKLKKKLMVLQPPAPPPSSATPDPGFGFAHALVNEIMQFPTPSFIDEDLSAASSSVTMENNSNISSSGSSNIHWASGGAGADDLLLADPEFYFSTSFFGDFINGYSSIWAASEAIP